MQIDFQNPAVVNKAFETLLDKDKIIQFMLGYLRYFIINRSKPTNLDFKRTIDTVNSELLSPIKNLNSNLDLLENEEIKAKVSLWKSAHAEYELKVIDELKGLVG